MRVLVSDVTNDGGAVGVAWVTKLAAVVLVIGVVGFDGFSIMSSRIKGEDDAQNAATAASATWQSTHNITSAYDSAEASVTGKHDRILTRDFSVDPDNTVHLLLRRDASTLIAGRIGPLRKYTIETVHGDANSNPP